MAAYLNRNFLERKTMKINLKELDFFLRIGNYLSDAPSGSDASAGVKSGTRKGLYREGGFIMIRILEDQELNEMAIQAVSSLADNLPFRITIKSPDHQPPHAHIMDNDTGKKEIGQFLIPASKPRASSDIKDYKQGITDEMRTTIFLWMRSRSKLLPRVTNWELLCTVWKLNETH
jgi:hypothetical protein